MRWDDEVGMSIARGVVRGRQKLEYIRHAHAYGAKSQPA